MRSIFDMMYNENSNSFAACFEVSSIFLDNTPHHLVSMFLSSVHRILQNILLRILFALFWLGILAVQKNNFTTAEKQYLLLNYMVSIDLLPLQQYQAKTQLFT